MHDESVTEERHDITAQINISDKRDRPVREALTKLRMKAFICMSSPSFLNILSRLLEVKVK